MIIGLVDLKSSRCFYTWNKRGNNANRVWSKIDRILVNLEWLASIQVCSAGFLPPGVSGHSPMIIDWKDRCFKTYPFRFNNKWTLIECFREFIGIEWSV